MEPRDDIQSLLAKRNEAKKPVFSKAFFFYLACDSGWQADWLLLLLLLHSTHIHWHFPQFEFEFEFSCVQLQFFPFHDRYLNFLECGRTSLVPSLSGLFFYFFVYLNFLLYLKI